jgi:hypothetical protein
MLSFLDAAAAIRYTFIQLNNKAVTVGDGSCLVWTYNFLSVKNELLFLD